MCAWSFIHPCLVTPSHCHVETEDFTRNGAEETRDRGTHEVRRGCNSFTSVDVILGLILLRHSFMHSRSELQIVGVRSQHEFACAKLAKNSEVLISWDFRFVARYSHLYSQSYDLRAVRVVFLNALRKKCYIVEPPECILASLFNWHKNTGSHVIR